MAAELKELIEKIQNEGVNAAKEKAKAIINDAELKAKSIIAKADKNADQIVEKARAEAKQVEESLKAAINQAARDLLLSLRGEINAFLSKIISLDIGKALSSSELPRLIEAVVRTYGKSSERGVVISLNGEDLEKLNKEFIRKLQEELKKEVILKASDGIRAGFIISFDAGKSQFDYSDISLTEYLASFVRPRLAEILKEQTENK